VTDDRTEAPHSIRYAAHELWQQEMDELVRRVFRARMLLLPLLLIVALVFLLFDTTPWKVWLIFGSVIAVGVLFAFERRRLRHQRANEGTVQINLLFALGIQSVLVYVTGGFTSPMLVVFVPLVALAGLGLTQRWRLVSVVTVPFVIITLLALGVVTDLLPSMIPAFLHPQDSPVKGAAWLVARAAMLFVVLIITTIATHTARAAFERVVREAIQIRQHALDTLESRNRELLSTGVTIAHELKNPLSSIQGLTQLMARRMEPGTKDKERTDVMLREIQRMSTVLDEFRNLTRPLSGLSRGSVALTELVQSVVTLHEGVALRRGVSLTLETNTPIVVECDASKVEQALVNLVQNALEASPQGTTVRIDISESSETVSIRVRDQGPGIDKHQYNQIFTPGFTTKERGTGIGLIVARSVIEQHGGTLRLNHGPTGGTEATIVLPRHAQDTMNAGEALR
jgi:signal transduction histidine kinase